MHQLPGEGRELVQTRVGAHCQPGGDQVIKRFKGFYVDSQLPCLISLFIFVWSHSEANPKKNWLRGEQACLLTIWFHAKSSKETLKKSKSLILLRKFGSRAQKWPKIAKKTDHSIAIYSIFCIGMVYFGCLQVNPHIQAVQNMCGKGG